MKVNIEYDIKLTEQELLDNFIKYSKYDIDGIYRIADKALSEVSWMNNITKSRKLKYISMLQKHIDIFMKDINCNNDIIIENRKYLKKGKKLYIAYYKEIYFVGYIDNVDSEKGICTIKLLDDDKVEIVSKYIDGDYDCYCDTIFTHKNVLNKINTVFTDNNKLRESINKRIKISQKIK